METQLERLVAHVRRREDKPTCRSQEPTTAEPIQRHATNNRDLNNLAPFENIHRFPPLVLQTQVLMQRPCGEGCHCSCHQPKNLLSPRLVENIIGHLFIGFTGPALIYGSCNDSRCRQGYPTSLRLTYRFPYWFWQRAISIAFSFRSGVGPELAVRVPYVRPMTADWFRYARRGDVEGMKNLLKSGKASGKFIRLVVSCIDRLV